MPIRNRQPGRSVLASEICVKKKEPPLGSLNGDGIKATNKKYGTTLDARPTIFLEYGAQTCV